MKEYIEKRVIEAAEYIAETGATVRKTAKKINVSKSTVHKDVSERLQEIDQNLFKEVRKILDLNLQERHLRGGMATKLKYSNRDIKDLKH